MEPAAAAAAPVKIQVSVATAEQLSKLLSFCAIEGFPVTPAAAAFFTPDPFDTKPRKPTAAFKEFCGSPWLNRKGEISPADVYDYIKSYVRIARLEAPDGTIVLPEELRTALATEKGVVYSYELHSLVAGAFAPPKP